MSQVRDIAESGRRATEHFAAASEASSEARDARIFDAPTLTRSAPGFALGERYYVRADASGWSVYDRIRGNAASIGEKVQTGLTYEKAQEAAAILQASDHQNWK